MLLPLLGTLVWATITQGWTQVAQGGVILGTESQGTGRHLASTDSCFGDGTVKSAQKISNLYGSFPYTLEQYDQIGWSSVSLGDIDGDGVADIASGALKDDDGQSNAGAVYVIFLTTSGVVKSAQKISSSYGKFPHALGTDDWFGYAVAAPGDLDDDGVNDLAVSAYSDDDGNSGAGAVYILFLTTDGLVKSAQKISNSYGNFPYALDGGDWMGSSATSIGDLDGDGVTDLAVGATGDADGWSKAGALYLLFLETTGLVKSAQKISNSYGNFPYSLQASDKFGYAATSLGDLNGDGVTDIVAGATGDDDGNDGAGAVYVIFLTTSGVVKAAQKISNSYGNFPYTLDSSDEFGRSSVSLGDLDEDGVPDLVVGAPKDDDGSEADSGAAYVIFLGTNGAARFAQKISNSYGNFPYTIGDHTNGAAYFGMSCSSPGDMDGDGTSDLVVGSCHDADGYFAAGSLYIIFLGAICPSPTPTPAPTQTAAPTAMPTVQPTPIPTLIPTTSPTPMPTPVCASGSYLDGSLCQTCSSGKYNPAEGQSGEESCSICSYGRFASNSGASNCTLCPAGRFNDYDSSDPTKHDELQDCSNCSAGRYSLSNRLTCQTCSAGQYVLDAAECVDCEPGRFAMQAMTGSCGPCQSGNFNPRSGATSCRKCPATYDSAEGASNCSRCIPDYMMDNSDTCVKCPDGADCGQVGSVLRSLDIKNGFYRFDEDSTNVYPCSKKLNCIGGNGTGSQLCSQSAAGPLCGGCKVGFYIRDALDSCRKCGNQADFWWLSPMIVVIVVAFAIALSYWNREAMIEWQKGHADAEKDVSTRVTALFINMQIIVLIQSNHAEIGGKATPTPYGNFINSLSGLSMDLVQMVPADCLATSRWSHYDSLLLETLGPLIVIAVVFVYENVRREPRGNSAKRGYYLGQVLMFVFLVLLPAISRRVCQTFQCRTFEPGIRYLVSDLSTSCTTAKYSAFKVFAILMCLVYTCGFPVGLYFWLRRFKNRLDDPMIDEQALINNRKEDQEISNHPVACRGLYYRPRYWFFDTVVMFRRLLLTSFVLVFEDPALCVVFLLLVSILGLIIEREAQPYVRPETSMNVYILQWQVVFFIQGLLLVDANLTSSVGSMTIGISLLVLNLLLVGVIAVGARESLKRAEQLSRKTAMRLSIGMRRLSFTGPSRQSEIELSDVYRPSGPTSAGPTKHGHGDQNRADEISTSENPLSSAMHVNGGTTHDVAFAREDEAEEPSSLPAPWEEHRDHKYGHPCYVNTQTQEVTWHRPAILTSSTSAHETNEVKDILSKLKLHNEKLKSMPGYENL